jgi:DNA repair protein RecO (recombination protein O)
LIWFDNSEKNSNFHILFLIYLTNYLGIIPEKNINNLKFFDIENGKFNSSSNSINCITGEVVGHLSLILGTKFDYSSQVLTNVKQRRNMIDLILKYYKVHVPGFKLPKSVDVLNDLFS